MNFSNGDIADWNWIGDPIFGTEPQSFYVPIISDPVGQQDRCSSAPATCGGRRRGAWARMTLAEFRQHCNEWFGDFTVVCGDWQPLGDSRPWPGRTAPADRLRRRSRRGGFVAAVERAPQRHVHAAGRRRRPGRVFISKNADAEPASAVTFTRLDSLAANDPEPLRQRHPHRSGEPEPRLDLLQRASTPRRRRRPVTCSR